MFRANKKAPSRTGFSLVEVILAIGVFALTIVAVIGLLGPTAQQVRDLEDLKVVNSLPGPIREELNRVGFFYFVESDLDGVKGLPIFLYALEDGSRVVAYETENGDTVVPAEGSQGAALEQIAIDPADRYFEIQVSEATGNLAYQAGSAYVAMNVVITWPHNVPTDGAGGFEPVADEDQSSFEYPTAVVAGEPF